MNRRIRRLRVARAARDFAFVLSALLFTSAAIVAARERSHVAPTPAFASHAAGPSSIK